MDAKTSIWTEEEVNIKAEELPDDRPQPKFDVIRVVHNYGLIGFNEIASRY